MVFLYIFFALSLSHTLLAYIEMEIVLLLLWSITTNQNNTHLVFGRIYIRVFGLCAPDHSTAVIAFWIQASIACREN